LNLQINVCRWYLRSRGISGNTLQYCVCVSWHHVWKFVWTRWTKCGKRFMCAHESNCVQHVLFGIVYFFLQLFCCMLTFSTDNINGDTDVHCILHCLCRIVLLNISCIYLSTFSEDLYLIAVWLWLHTFYTSSRSWHVNEPYLSLV